MKKYCSVYRQHDYQIEERQNIRFIKKGSRSSVMMILNENDNKMTSIDAPLIENCIQSVSLISFDIEENCESFEEI